MDSAKKTRLKGILDGIAKDAMYDQYTYLKRKNEVRDKIYDNSWEEKS